MTPSSITSLLDQTNQHLANQHLSSQFSNGDIMNYLLTDPLIFGELLAISLTALFLLKLLIGENQFKASMLWTESRPDLRNTNIRTSVVELKFDNEIEVGRTISLRKDYLYKQSALNRKTTGQVRL